MTKRSRDCGPLAEAPVGRRLPPMRVRGRRRGLDWNVCMRVGAPSSLLNMYVYVSGGGDGDAAKWASSALTDQQMRRIWDAIGDAARSGEVRHRDRLAGIAAAYVKPCDSRWSASRLLDEGVRAWAQSEQDSEQSAGDAAARVIATALDTKRFVLNCVLPYASIWRDAFWAYLSRTERVLLIRACMLTPGIVQREAAYVSRVRSAHRPEWMRLAALALACAAARGGDLEAVHALHCLSVASASGYRCAYEAVACELRRPAPGLCRGQCMPPAPIDLPEATPLQRLGWAAGAAAFGPQSEPVACMIMSGPGCKKRIDGHGLEVVVPPSPVPLGGPGATAVFESAMSRFVSAVRANVSYFSRGPGGKAALLWSHCCQVAGVEQSDYSVRSEVVQSVYLGPHQSMQPLRNNRAIGVNVNGPRILRLRLSATFETGNYAFTTDAIFRICCQSGCVQREGEWADTEAPHAWRDSSPSGSRGIVTGLYHFDDPARCLPWMLLSMAADLERACAGVDQFTHYYPSDVSGGSDRRFRHHYSRCVDPERYPGRMRARCVAAHVRTPVDWSQRLSAAVDGGRWTDHAHSDIVACNDCIGGLAERCARHEAERYIAHGMH